MKEAVLCLRAASFIVAKSVYYLSQRKKRSNPINKQTYLFYSQPKLGRLFFFDKRCVVELDVAIKCDHAPPAVEQSADDIFAAL